MDREPEGRLARADGATMTYRRLGAGPPVVCLAGGPGSDARYLEDLAGLDRTHELIVPDARGTGRSDVADDSNGYGFDQIALDLDLLRIHLGLNRLVVVAHSAACTPTLLYAASHPGAVAGLVLVAPSRWLHEEVEDDTNEILERRYREPWYSDVVAAQERLRAGPSAAEMPGVLAGLAPAMYASWGPREQSHARAMQSDNWSATAGFWRTDVDGQLVRSGLAAVRAPVLVVTGALDMATGVNAGAAWAACFADGRHVTLANAGHNPWVDEPAVFRRTVSEFLASLPQ